MPIRTLKIVDGPSFRGFAVMNGIISESSWDTTFTMDREIPDDFTIHKDRRIFQMGLKLFGRAPSDDVDEFAFIAYMSGNSARTKSEVDKHRWFYVGTYNTRTRKGRCDEYSVSEFFRSPILRALFPNLI